MRHHVPKPPQRHRRDGKAELRNVPFEESLEKLAAPLEGIGLAARRVGQRESASQPVPVLRGGPEIGEAKAFQREGLQPAGQRFGGLAEQVWRGAAQNQETRRQGPAICQDAQQGEQLGAALDFVNDDQSLEWAQRGFRFGQPGQTGRGFEVEIVKGIRLDEFAGEGGFATLARAEKPHHPAAFQRGADGLGIGGSRNHGKMLRHENPPCNGGITWCEAGWNRGVAALAGARCKPCLRRARIKPISVIRHSCHRCFLAVHVFPPVGGGRSSAMPEAAGAASVVPTLG